MMFCFAFQSLAYMLVSPPPPEYMPSCCSHLDLTLLSYDPCNRLDEFEISILYLTLLFVLNAPSLFCYTLTRPQPLRAESFTSYSVVQCQRSLYSTECIGRSSVIYAPTSYEAR